MNDPDPRDRESLEPKLCPAERQRIDEALKRWDEFLMEDPSARDAENYQFIKTSIDITKPIQDTFASLEREIDLRRWLYRARIGPLPDHRRKRRLRLDQYPIYLRVWNLRNKRNLSFEKIACKLFPKEMENPYGRGPIVKRVRTDYKRACELVSGGYRQIEP